MKALFPIIFILTFAFIGHSQTNNNYPQWQHPILQQLRANSKNLTPIYNRDSTAFVTVSVIDRKQKIIYWFDCFGYYFDAVPISGNNIQAILAKKITAFKYYDLITAEYLKVITKGRSRFQTDGNTAKFTSYEKQLLQIDDSIQFPSTLKKIIELDKQKLSVERKTREFHSITPTKIKEDTVFSKTLALQYGSMEASYQYDTIITYYNRIALGPVYKAVLNNTTSSITYYNREGQPIDEIKLDPNKVSLLCTEKTDVFLLYRGWLELLRHTIVESIANIKAAVKKLNGVHATIDKSQFLYASNNLQLVLNYSYQILKTTDYKIDYLTTIDKGFVSQCLKKQYQQSTNALTARKTYLSTFTRGNKFYELTDARGNVMAVVTDKKIAHSSSGTTIDYYEPDIIITTDYAPFGSSLSGRNYQSEKYRYGYNGKENDNEVKGKNNQIDYDARIYDPRLGRFLSTDPLTKLYSFYSPYQFSGNTPIQAIDLDGLEPEFIINKQGKLTKPMISLFNAAFGYSQVEMQNTHWKKANTSFNAQTIYHTIKYGAKTDLDKFDNTDMWTDFWLNLTVHENRHRTEYSGIGSWLRWSASYLVMTAIEDSKEHDDKFYSRNTPAEKRAYGIEAPMVSLMNFQNSLALKVLESNYNDNIKVGIMQYVGTSYNLQNAQAKLNNLNTKQSTFDGTNKQAKKLEKQIKKQEKIVQDLSTEVNNLKGKYTTEISELDKKQGREIKLVTESPKQKE